MYGKLPVTGGVAGVGGAVSIGSGSVGFITTMTVLSTLLMAGLALLRMLPKPSVKTSAGAGRPAQDHVHITSESRPNEVNGSEQRAVEVAGAELEVALATDVALATSSLLDVPADARANAELRRAGPVSAEARDAADSESTFSFLDAAPDSTSASQRLWDAWVEQSAVERDRENAPAPATTIPRARTTQTAPAGQNSKIDARNRLASGLQQTTDDLILGETGNSIPLGAQGITSGICLSGAHQIDHEYRSSSHRARRAAVHLSQRSAGRRLHHHSSSHDERTWFASRRHSGIASTDHSPLTASSWSPVSTPHAENSVTESGGCRTRHHGTASTVNRRSNSLRMHRADLPTARQSGTYHHFESAAFDRSHSHRSSPAPALVEALPSTALPQPSRGATVGEARIRDMELCR